jgi:hypothetical protein
MAYNSVADKVVLFGGVTGGPYSDEGINGETWIYDPATNQWLDVTVTSSSP